MNKTEDEIFADMFAAYYEGLREGKPRWTSVVERLPEESGWYLVNVEAPYKPIRIYKFEPIKGNYGNNLWRDGDGGDGFYVADWFVSHWMPLPEPPKDGE